MLVDVDQPAGIECLCHQVDDALVVVLEVVRAVVVGYLATPSGGRAPTESARLLQHGDLGVGRTVDDVGRRARCRTCTDNTDIHTVSRGSGH